MLVYEIGFIWIADSYGCIFQSHHTTVASQSSKSGPGYHPNVKSDLSIWYSHSNVARLMSSHHISPLAKSGRASCRDRLADPVANRLRTSRKHIFKKCHAWGNCSRAFLWYWLSLLWNLQSLDCADLYVSFKSILPRGSYHPDESWDFAAVHKWFTLLAAQWQLEQLASVALDDIRVQWILLAPLHWLTSAGALQSSTNNKWKRGRHWKGKIASHLVHVLCTSFSCSVAFPFSFSWSWSCQSGWERRQDTQSKFLRRPPYHLQRLPHPCASDTLAMPIPAVNFNQEMLKCYDSPNPIIQFYRSSPISFSRLIGCWLRQSAMRSQSASQCRNRNNKNN